MSFDTFEIEVDVIEKAEAKLRGSLTDQDCREEFEGFLGNYKKLLKISRRIVRMSDRSEKGLISARNQIQEQQVSLETAHQELKRLSEHRLRTIVEATPVGIVISQVENGEIIYANAIAGPQLGLESERLLGLNVTDFFLAPSEREKIAEILKRNGQVDHYQLQFKKTDDSILWADYFERHLVFNEQPCILSACNDITHLREMNEAASRFVPGEYLSFLHKDSFFDITLGDHVTDVMTIMFTDLRSFTTMSEEMTPQQSFDFINAYLSRVGPVVRDYRGFVVNYLGDGIMAIFPECADDGLQASIEKLNQVNIYNEERVRVGRLPIKIGIGVSTGHMMVGMVGEPGRMQGDVFSDNVNLTSRLEGLTKFYNVSFIISAATKDALKDTSKYNIRYLDKIQVKGTMKALDLYEVFDSDLPEMRSLKQETLEMYQEAMEHYFAKDFSATQSLLFKVLQKKPNDKVAWHHLMNTTRNLEAGVSDA